MPKIYRFLLCGFRYIADAQQFINVAAQIEVNVSVLEYVDAFKNEAHIVFIEGGLFDNVVKHFKDCPCGTVRLDGRVAFIVQHFDICLNGLNLAVEIFFDSLIGLFDLRCLIRVLGNVLYTALDAHFEGVFLTGKQLFKLFD